MKTTLTALGVAALLAAVATEIFFRFFAGQYLVLLAMCFVASIVTALATVRFAVRQPDAEPRTRAPRAKDRPRQPDRPRERPRERSRQSERPRQSDRPRQPEPKREELPPGAKRETGTVKWFDRTKGYGFVIREDGDEIFVHHRSIQREGRERPGLEDGQAVSFVAVERERGWQAEDVSPE